MSILLQRDGIAHRPMAGRLSVEAVGQIVPHCWIAPEDGRRIDLRARMWLGNGPQVPHGIVPAHAPGLQYEGAAFHVADGPVVFWALTDTTVDAFAPAYFLQACMPTGRSSVTADAWRDKTATPAAGRAAG